MITVKELEKKYYHNRLRVGIQFREMIHSYLSPEKRVLNAGCGHSGWLELKGNCREVVGTDVDDSALDNPDLDQCIIGDLETVVLPGTYDLIICSYVVEHLKNPNTCFQNFSHLLNQGGILLIMTPNLLHYAMIISKLTPNSFHRWFLKEKPENAYPTYYRANRPGKLVKGLTELGFRIVELRMAEGPPDYLAFSVPTYLLGVGYERTLNAFKQLGGLRSAILLAAEKIA